VKGLWSFCIFGKEVKIDFVKLNMYNKISKTLKDQL
jgi:hypothetical protein